MEAAKQFRKRNAILACLQGTTSHPSAEMVYEMLQKEHSEPEELTETVQVVEVSFSGQEYRGRQALCAGYRGAAPCWGQGARPIGRLRAAAPSGQG